MRLPIYQVDAFTDRLFGGNPAAVVPLTEWLPEATMQAVAAENNLAETAFFVREGKEFAIRWFTPTVEAALCGHATLASAYVVSRFLDAERRHMEFTTGRQEHSSSSDTATNSRWTFRCGNRPRPRRPLGSPPLSAASRHGA